MKPEHDFKVGDTIELIGTNRLRALKGAKAVVISIDAMPIYLKVNWLDKKSRGQINGNYFPCSFKPVKRAPKKDELKEAATKALQWFKWQSGEEPSQDDRPLSAKEVTELLEEALKD